ncbi:MAG TPA: hypothetical protein EYP10_12905, partial [Armatimonadetes bacterium]|nr:hypothetical protein [Armatimonadota bacterium]
MGRFTSPLMHHIKALIKEEAMDKVAKCNAQNAQATICLLFIALQQCWCAPNASTAILWGRVVSRQDDPIASAKVCVWLLKPVHGQSAILAETHTDGKGRYRLSNLPAGVKLGVAFSAPMFATELMQVTLKGGEVRRLDAMLFRPSSITGSIIDRHTGDVFAGLEVRIVAVRVIKPEEGMDALPNIYKCTQVTDAEGRYHLSGMRPGEYVVQITSPLICTGAMDPWNTGFPKHTAAIRIQVKEGKEMTGADIIVERPGQLLLHVAPQERIAILREYWDSLRLRIESVEFDSVAATIATLRDGRVCVPVRSGLRRLMVWMLNAPVLEDVVRFLPGEVIERRISLPPIALIEGRVLDKHGKPVPNARVRVISTLSAPSDAPVHEAV